MLHAHIKIHTRRNISLCCDRCLRRRIPVILNRIRLFLGRLVILSADRLAVSICIITAAVTGTRTGGSGVVSVRGLFSVGVFGEEFGRGVITAFVRRF